MRYTYIYSSPEFSGRVNTPFRAVRVAAKDVSMPMEPLGALRKSPFSSGEWGAWSVEMASMVPSFKGLDQRQPVLLSAQGRVHAVIRVLGLQGLVRKQQVVGAGFCGDPHSPGLGVPDQLHRALVLTWQM